jgi:acyl-coenzyme A thioesterase PaaI-like protein
MIQDPVYDKFCHRTVKEHEVLCTIPWRDTCYGCRPKSSRGLHVRTYRTKDGYVVGTAHTDEEQNGFPKVTHGGILSTYFDEVCWFQTKRDDPSRNAMTVEMTVHYWHPVMENTDVLIVADGPRFEGRHCYVDGMIVLPDQTVAATATVHYLVLKEGSEVSRREYKRILHNWQPSVTSLRF